MIGKGVDRALSKFTRHRLVTECNLERKIVCLVAYPEIVGTMTTQSNIGDNSGIVETLTPQSGYGHIHYY